MNNENQQQHQQSMEGSGAGEIQSADDRQEQLMERLCDALEDMASSLGLLAQELVRAGSESESDQQEQPSKTEQAPAKEPQGGVMFEPEQPPKFIPTNQMPPHLITHPAR